MEKETNSGRAPCARGKLPYLLCFLLPLMGAYYSLKAGLAGDLSQRKGIRIASGAGAAVWVLLILAVCWIAGAF